MKTRYNYLPLCLIVVFLSFTLILYEFGPFAWITYDPGKFWLLNCLYILALILGWTVGTTIKVPTPWCETKSYSRTIHILKFAIPVNLCYEYLNALRKFQLHSLNPMNLLYAIHKGTVNMGDAYNMYQSSVGASSVTAIGGKPLTLFSLTWEFFAFNIIILSIIFFRYISWTNKLISICTIVLIAAEYIATGTNIGVFRLLLVFIILLGIHLVQKLNEGGTEQHHKSGIFILASAFAVIMMILLFDSIMKSRGGINYWKYSNYNIGGIRIDNDSIFFKMLPSGLHMLLISAAGYLTQGYYGFSLCLRVPWKYCYGVGHSVAITNLLRGLTNSIRENTYQYRITKFGWEDGMRWHSFYSWIANDTSFAGVIIVMFVIGIVFCVAYRDSVLSNNPFAKLVVFYLGLMAFFIPCNNQLFQSTYVLFSFITSMLLWVCTRGKKKILINSGVNC